jgi:hypothetical protein
MLNDTNSFFFLVDEIDSTRCDLDLRARLALRICTGDLIPIVSGKVGGSSLSYAFLEKPALGFCVIGRLSHSAPKGIDVSNSAFKISIRFTFRP